MKEKKEKIEIATNVSSGAEKVEKIVKGKTALRTEERLMDMEEERAQQRVNKALKKQEEKEARLKQKEEEKERKQRERAHQKANQRQARAKKGENRPSHKGYGGWLAAVISLAVATLILTTTVIIGGIDLKRTKEGTVAGYKSTTYELVGIMENVDNDLDRIRVSNSSVQQSRILTDLLLQTRLAELDLEKLPISAEADANTTTFLNKVARESERMLSKLRRGGTLSSADEELLRRFYEINHSVKKELENYVSKMTDKDVISYVKNGKGSLQDLLSRLENVTIEENNLSLKQPTTEEGSDKKRTTGEENTKPNLTTADAEKLCVKYFADYHIDAFTCVGETVTQRYGAYNVQGYDKEDRQLFAEIDYQSGALIRFDYYEDCNNVKYDVDQAKMLAEEFLVKLGYEDMSAVRVNQTGATADFTFVYTYDDIACYPDTVKIKVCLERGTVSGFDASRYLLNHNLRRKPIFLFNLEQAQNRLREGIEVQSSRPAIIDTSRGEKTAYEFYCSYLDNEYLIYIDALSGIELSIVNVNTIR